MMSTYVPPAPFNSMEEKWGSYMSRFEWLLVASDLQGLPDLRKKALFLSHCGAKVFDMAEALSELNSVHTILWQTLQTLLKDHYAPTPSKYVQRFDFRQQLQQEGESISEYVTPLHKAANQCAYRDLNEMLLEQLNCGVKDIRLQRRLLAKTNLTLQMALDEARAQESSSKAAERLQSCCHSLPGLLCPHSPNLTEREIRERVDRGERKEKQHWIERRHENSKANLK